MPQIIYTMKKLRKTTPQGKEILKGIWLSFYEGAKIGVLGHNGAGKSTLLRIMAGLDKDFDGEAFLAEGYSVGFLPQEPQLDPGKTVLQHVEDAVSEKKAVLARYEELSMNYSDEDALTSSRACRTASITTTSGSSTASSRSPWTRCGCRRPTPT